MINQDPKSDEIIRPLLRGRDIKRYSYEFADLYLITTFPSLKIDIELYPAVKQHLLSFSYDRLKQTGDKGSRKKTNNKWFETQDSISYWEDFYKQKIVYNDIAKRLTFSLVESGVFFNNTVYFINCGNINEKYLLAFLNSTIINWYYRTLSVQLGSNAVRMFSIYVQRIPIPSVELNLDKPVVELVNTLLEKKEKTSFSTEEIEYKINNLVCNIYGLSDIEINFIQSQ